MKSQETKAAFIRMRAEGKSYAKIAEALGISKSTCSAWERELAASIAELKQEQLNELYEEYHMTKEARIKKLGDTLGSINEALEAADLSEMAPERLLDFKLKYIDALKGEYAGTGKPYQFEGKINPENIVEALGDLLNRVRNGEVTPEQASRESAVISSLLKAYDIAEIQTKLEALESIIGGRA